MKNIKYFIAMMMMVFAITPSWASDGKKKNKPSEVNTVQKLSVSGSQLVGEDGQPVVLHGISYGWHQIWPRFWNKESCTYFVKEWGADVIRASLGVSRPFNEEMNNSYLQDPALGLRCLFEVVDAAIANNAYVIIDWHSHDVFEEDAIKFFRQMAIKYRGVPNVIYELFNEPDYESWEEVKIYSKKVIKVIREIEPEAVILVGCPHWDQDIDKVAKDPITGEKNIMYTMHFYAATHGPWLRERTDAAIAKGIPVFVSECAGMEASGDGPIDTEAWKAYVDWMQERKLSWCAWSVADKVESCSMLVPGASATGYWTEDELKPWAKIVRESIAKFRPQQTKPSKR